MNILIVHYNTPELLEPLILSINKNTPDSNIYIFENSDDKKFINTFKNVNIIDNSKQQLVKFQTYYNGSAKHTLSVDKCFDIINEDFVLLDSDVIVKKDLNLLIDKQCIFVSSIVNESRGNIIKPSRITPWCCYINIKLCKENNIRFFYKDYMLSISQNAEGNFDTGAAFYKFAKKYKYKEININEFINHYNCGSWRNLADKQGYIHKYSLNDFLELNKCYYLDSSNICPDMSNILKLP